MYASHASRWASRELSVTHPEAIRNALCNLVVDQIYEGTPPGKIELQTAADAVAATLLFGNPAFGNAAGGVANANAIAQDTNAAGGVVAKAVMKNAAGQEKFRCSVSGPGGGDIELSTTNINAGQTVTISALSYEASA